MAPKFPRCLEIINQIGDKRIEKILHAVFSREKKAYLCDKNYYNQRIEEVKARIEHRNGIIKELKKMGSSVDLDEYVSDLKSAQHVDFAEIGWLFQKSYRASLYDADKRKMEKKLKRFL